MSATTTYKELWRVKGSGREEEMEIRCKVNYYVGKNGKSHVFLVQFSECGMVSVY